MEFPTRPEQIMKRIQGINPERYAFTRNYVNGALTYLSPYISRGVISTKKVYKHIMTLGLPWYKTEKLIQELAWRDYWQQVWIAKGKNIYTELKQKQSPVSNHKIPVAIVNAKTGIEAMDGAIKKFYDTGYMHNHMRMYVASVCCNTAHSHWLAPAKWMYAHLLDGDLGSNHLSWQWVAGAFSSKKYYANQNNINQFFNTSQKNTFLDIDYNELSRMETPKVLTSITSLKIKPPLPQIPSPVLKQNKTTLIYNYYNLDPEWRKGEDVQRVLLLEPSFFQENPISRGPLDFIFKLAKNIENIQIFIGEFSDIQQQVNADHIVFREHPTNSHYQGTEVPREWLTSVSGNFPSFFAFWKQCKKELKPRA